MVDCDVGVVIVKDRIWKFCLFGIVIDSVFNIFVFDIFMIYLIDIDGKFICFLNIVCLILMWLVLDEDDYFYIVDKYGNVKIV